MNSEYKNKQKKFLISISVRFIMAMRKCNISIWLCGYDKYKYNYKYEYDCRCEYNYEYE